jgi:molybdopterin converting factor small subunit
VVLVRLFAGAREAAGTGRAEVAGSTVSEVIDEAVRRFGADFAALLPSCQVWVNGSAADPGQSVGPGDELAVLPPVSGGAR